MAEREDEIADATAINVMTDDVETGICFQKRVEHMDRFACRGSDDLGVEWGISA